MKRQLLRLAAGVVAAAAIATIARRARALSPSGAVAATFIGGAVVCGMGVRAGAALVAFFASSTLLGRLPQPSILQEQHRGNERDGVQVLANGGVPALFALGSLVAPPEAAETLRVGLGGAIATAAADTWATELGMHLGGWPRSIATLRRVPRGASGGVTGAGLAASALGAATIAAVLIGPSRGPRHCRQLVSVTIGGCAGALADSLLGATLQVVHWCPTCQEETESLIHRCGTPTRHRRGRTWCSNDTVNALATATGALVAAAAVNARRPATAVETRPGRRRRARPTARHGTAPALRR